ncbi:uncharacterized protein LOC128908409 isoform X1 [Rissa tridactyla]|uniref:uncharacterized protein LOC128908409 isoform X1 n=1 Tax=Rissa tridactyla TaxID=75485 RepID=UPI0023BA7803|nr:uncharacterized protein LOC128908409 isoform X1 [Rissa tridactyla]
MKPRQTEVSIPLQPPGRGPTPDAGPDGQPRDYVLWSLFNVLLGYALAYLGCLCFPALVFSIKGDVSLRSQHRFAATPGPGRPPLSPRLAPRGPATARCWGTWRVPGGTAAAPRCSTSSAP